MDTPHKGLHRLALVFTVVAWGAVVMGVVGSVGIFITGGGLPPGGGGPPPPPKSMGLVVLLMSGLYSCLFHALSGIIRLLLLIEEQVRKPV